MIFNQAIAGGGSASGEHGIYCEIRGNIDVPTSADTGDTVTMTLTSKSGITPVMTIVVGTATSGSGVQDVTSWSMARTNVGDTKSFAMPDSDIIIRFLS